MRHEKIIRTNLRAPVASTETMREIADALDRVQAEALENLPDDATEEQKHPAISEVAPSLQQDSLLDEMPPLSRRVRRANEEVKRDPDNPGHLLPEDD